MVRELTDEEILKIQEKHIFKNLFGQRFTEPLGFAKALFEAARVQQTER